MKGKSKKLEKFWNTLEDLQTLAAVRAEWQHLLGDELPDVKDLLRLTQVFAESFPNVGAAGLGVPLRAVQHGLDDIVGVDDETDSRVPLTRADVSVLEVDVRELACRVASALRLNAVARVDSQDRPPYYLGRLKPADENLQVFLCLPTEPDDVARDVAALIVQGKAPFLLLAPTARFISAAVELRLQDARSGFLPLKDAVELANGTWSITDQAIQAALPDTRGNPFGDPKVTDADAVEQPYRFRLLGAMWDIAFAGKREPCNDSVGLGYIHELLSSPKEPIPSTLLGGSNIGLGQEISDLTTLKRVREEMRTLKLAIDKANRDGDLSTATRSREERDRLAEQLNLLVRPGGIQREFADEVQRARKSVCNAVSRAIGELRVPHPDLARHLKSSIKKGSMLVYMPEEQFEWEL